MADNHLPAPLPPYQSTGRKAAAGELLKEAINAVDEMSLEQGGNYERRLFHSCFATKDQKEGMNAFVNKRPAEWTNE